MDEPRKLYRVFQLITRLRSPLGCIKQEVARDFDVSERTIERYFLLLRDLGFEIIKTENRFKIESVERRIMKHEDIIIFSLEEAAAIRDAILNCANVGLLHKSILDKLYALTELDELSETIYKQTVSNNINTIRLAIKVKQQVKLKGYSSVSSNKSKDYLIEPFRFFNYFRYLLAYDVTAGMVKQFKTERITMAEITGQNWQHEELHENNQVDVFGMTGTKAINVKLKVAKRARLLLEEEFPDAALSLKKRGGQDYYEGKVYSLKGVGRFVMGLLDEIEIIEPEALRQYVLEKIKNWDCDME